MFRRENAFSLRNFARFQLQRRLHCERADVPRRPTGEARRTAGCTGANTARCEGVIVLKQATNQPNTFCCASMLPRSLPSTVCEKHLSAFSWDIPGTLVQNFHSVKNVLHKYEYENKYMTLEDTTI